MWLVIVILIVAVHIYAIADVMKTPARNVNVVSKKFWAMIVIIPIIGPILWFFLGQQNAFLSDHKRHTLRDAKPPTAPDDDLEFLRILDIKKQQREEAKRLEQWRKDLQQREQKLKDDNKKDDDTDTAADSTSREDI